MQGVFKDLSQNVVNAVAQSAQDAAKKASDKFQLPSIGNLSQNIMIQDQQMQIEYGPRYQPIQSTYQSRRAFNPLIQPQKPMMQNQTMLLRKRPFHNNFKQVENTSISQKIISTPDFGELAPKPEYPQLPFPEMRERDLRPFTSQPQQPSQLKDSINLASTTQIQSSKHQYPMMEHNYSTLQKDDREQVVLQIKETRMRQDKLDRANFVMRQYFEDRLDIDYEPSNIVDLYTNRIAQKMSISQPDPSLKGGFLSNLQGWSWNLPEADNGFRLEIWYKSMLYSEKFDHQVTFVDSYHIKEQHRILIFTTDVIYQLVVKFDGTITKLPEQISTNHHSVILAKQLSSDTIISATDQAQILQLDLTENKKPQKLLGISSRIIRGNESKKSLKPIPGTSSINISASIFEMFNFSKSLQVNQIEVNENFVITLVDNSRLNIYKDLIQLTSVDLKKFKKVVKIQFNRAGFVEVHEVNGGILGIYFQQDNGEHRIVRTRNAGIYTKIIRHLNESNFLKKNPQQGTILVPEKQFEIENSNVNTDDKSQIVAMDKMSKIVVNQDEYYLIVEDTENSIISAKKLQFTPIYLKQDGSLIYIMTPDFEVIGFEWQSQLSVIKALMKDITNLASPSNHIHNALNRQKVEEVEYAKKMDEVNLYIGSIRAEYVSNDTLLEQSTLFKFLRILVKLILEMPKIKGQCQDLLEFVLDKCFSDSEKPYDNTLGENIDDLRVKSFENLQLSKYQLLKQVRFKVLMEVIWKDILSDDFLKQKLQGTVVSIEMLKNKLYSLEKVLELVPSEILPINIAIKDMIHRIIQAVDFTIIHLKDYKTFKTPITYHDIIIDNPENNLLSIKLLESYITDGPTADQYKEQQILNCYPLYLKTQMIQIMIAKRKLQKAFQLLDLYKQRKISYIQTCDQREDLSSHAMRFLMKNTLNTDLETTLGLLMKNQLYIQCIVFVLKKASDCEITQQHLDPQKQIQKYRVNEEQILTCYSFTVEFIEEVLLRIRAKRVGIKQSQTVPQKGPVSIVQDQQKAQTNRYPWQCCKRPSQNKREQKQASKEQQKQPVADVPKSQQLQSKFKSVNLLRAQLKHLNLDTLNEIKQNVLHLLSIKQIEQLHQKVFELLVRLGFTDDLFKMQQSKYLQKFIEQDLWNKNQTVDTSNLHKKIQTVLKNYNGQQLIEYAYSNLVKSKIDVEYKINYLKTVCVLIEKESPRLNNLKHRVIPILEFQKLVRTKIRKIFKKKMEKDEMVIQYLDKIDQKYSFEYEDDPELIINFCLNQGLCTLVVKGIGLLRELKISGVQRYDQSLLLCWKGLISKIILKNTPDKYQEKISAKVKRLERIIGAKERILEQPDVIRHILETMQLQIKDVAIMTKKDCGLYFLIDAWQGDKIQCFKTFFDIALDYRQNQPSNVNPDHYKNILAYLYPSFILQKFKEDFSGQSQQHQTLINNQAQKYVNKILRPCLSMEDDLSMSKEQAKKLRKYIEEVQEKTIL